MLLTLLFLFTVALLLTLALVNCGFFFGTGSNSEDEDDDKNVVLPKTHFMSAKVNFAVQPLPLPMKLKNSERHMNSKRKDISPSKNLFPYVPGGVPPSVVKKAKAPPVIPALKMMKDELVVNNPYLLWGARNPKNNGLVLIDNAAYQDALKAEAKAVSRSGPTKSTTGASSSDILKENKSSFTAKFKEAKVQSSTVAAHNTMSFIPSKSKQSPRNLPGKANAVSRLISKSRVSAVKAAKSRMNASKSKTANSSRHIVKGSSSSIKSKA